MTIVISIRWVLGLLLGEQIVVEDVMLRDMSPRDAEGEYARWMSDADVLRYLEARYHPPDAGDLARYIAVQSHSCDSILLAICRRSDGAHIGNIKLGFIVERHRRGDIGLLIGDREARGRGYGSMAISAVTEWGLRKLDLFKVTASCHADNIASMKCFLRAGFHEEGRRHHHFHRDGAWRDEVLLARFGQDRTVAT